MNLKKILLTFRNKRMQWHYSFCGKGKKEMYKYMQNEVSMIVNIVRITNQRKVPKWLP